MKVLLCAGKVIKGIQEDFNCTIELNDTGRVLVTADNEELANKVITHIQDLITDITVGTIYTNLEVSYYSVCM